MADWVSIKAEYIAGGINLRLLAEKHGVSYDWLRKVAAKEHWRNDRTGTAQKVHKKVQCAVVRKKAKAEVDRITRLLDISDRLAEKLEQAAVELDKKLVTNKKKTRTIEYKDLQAKGKPTKEVIDEIEIIDVVNAPIDRQGLQHLTSALKNLHEVIEPYQQSSNADIEDLTPLAKLLAEDPHE